MAILFIIFTAGAFVLILNIGLPPVDVTEVNNAVKTAEKNMRDHIPFSAMNYGFKFAVLDENGGNTALAQLS